MMNPPHCSSSIAITTVFFARTGKLYALQVSTNFSKLSKSSFSNFVSIVKSSIQALTACLMLSSNRGAVAGKYAAAILLSSKTRVETNVS